MPSKHTQKDNPGAAEHVHPLPEGMRMRLPACVFVCVCVRVRVLAAFAFNIYPWTA